MSSISEESPLAEQLKNAVQMKAVEAGWTQEDDTSLAEYIVLMVANGKTQGQIASELSGDLLQDAEGTVEFAQWLSEQVSQLTGGDSNNDSTNQNSQLAQQAQQEGTTIPAAYDNDLGDSALDNAYGGQPTPSRLPVLTYASPRGPRGLHGGRSNARGGRGRGDSALHRVRGNDRVNSHVRGAPKGPRNAPNKDVRPGMQKALNNLAQGQPMPAGMMPGAQPNSFSPMTAQQQMEFMSMMEQQARMMAQFMPNMMQPGMNGSFPQADAQNGRSLFDRVDRGRGGGARGRGRGGQQNGNSRKPSESEAEKAPSDTAMVTDSTTTTQTKPVQDPSSTLCYFNLRCTNKTCSYVHQSPVAPEGTAVDMNNTCSFGVACKNAKCTGKHPSPATIRAHQSEQVCKFWIQGACMNAACSFKHPSTPICSFGASCKNENCRFTHLEEKCRFNPCTNARCPYKHDEGQNKSFESYQWTPDKGKMDENGDHVSTRKFIADEGMEEELVKPQSEQGNATMTNAGSGGQAPEVVT